MKMMRKIQKKYFKWFISERFLTKLAKNKKLVFKNKIPVKRNKGTTFLNYEIIYKDKNKNHYSSTHISYINRN